MAFFATNGSKFYIGGAKSAPSGALASSDFTGTTWTEVKGLENLGSAGDTSEAVTFQTVDMERSQTIKGSRSAGTMEIVVAVNATDAGQIAVIAAEKTIHDYAFRLVLNDAPEGGTPSERMFVGKVMSQSEQFDAANNVVKMKASIAINSNIVRVNAAD